MILPLCKDCEKTLEDDNFCANYKNRRNDCLKKPILSFVCSLNLEEVFHKANCGLCLKTEFHF